MTSKVFDSVTFEADKLPTITGGTFANGMPATALGLGQADEWQAYLLYKGPCHSLIFGQSNFMGTVSGSASGTIRFMLPPYATHVQIGLVASGVGDVTFEGTYTISVSNPAGSGSLTDLEFSNVVWGPTDDQALSAGISHTGAFNVLAFDWTRDADVAVSGCILRFFRRSTTL